MTATFVVPPSDAWHDSTKEAKEYLCMASIHKGDETGRRCENILLSQSMRSSAHDFSSGDKTMLLDAGSICNEVLSIPFHKQH